MNYTKPQFVIAGSALTSVKSGDLQKPIAAVTDFQVRPSNGAYQADE